MEAMYDALAPYYDELNSEIDCERWADFIDRRILEFAPQFHKKGAIVCDLGCGTGAITLPLAARGYSMIGIDLSHEMLSVAAERAREAGEDILFLSADMCDFDLYGTVAVFTACLDAVNHLTEKGALDAMLSRVSLFLERGGLFIFDVNTKRKFETVYRDKTYAFETDGAFVVWESDYSEKSKRADFRITLFEQQGDGSYLRSEERRSERMYTLRTLKSAAKRHGLQLLAVYDEQFEKTEENNGETDRMHIVLSRV